MDDKELKGQQLAGLGMVVVALILGLASVAHFLKLI
jgi:hypothetical protein